MSRGIRLVQLDEAAHLPERFTELLSVLRLVTIRAGRLDVLLDDVKEHIEDNDVKDKVTASNDALFEATKTANQYIRAVNCGVRISTVTNAMVNVITAAQDLVQADNACIIGREGCEARWDACLAQLKEALSRFRM